MSALLSWPSAPILVVGGSRGIGHALVSLLLRQGASVITVSRSGEGTEGVQAHLLADVLADGLPVDRLPAKLGGLAYCPGSIDLRPARSLRPDDLRRAFEVNVVGAFRCIQASLPLMKGVEGAGIVLFSTVAVGQGMAFHAAVSAAKGGVEGLARALAAELAPAIRVNAVAPGLVDTPLADRLLNTPEKRAASAERHPMKRIGSAEDVAGMAAYLLSPQAAWITGQVVAVDGGLSRLR